MTNADDVIVLPVPETVQAVYLVPVDEPPGDLDAMVRAHATGRWTGLLRQIMTDLLNGPHPLPISVERADLLTPVARELLSISGASPAQLRRIADASHLVVVSMRAYAGWPPGHEWIARAMAALLADRLHSDVIDQVGLRVLTPAEADATLPGDADGHIRLADWVWVDSSSDRAGYWMTTIGLRRFGLPELQTLSAPPNVVESWAQAMTGISHRVLAAWSTVLAADQRAAFVALPAKVQVTDADVAVAYGRSGIGEAQTPAAVRLALDPGFDPEAHSFLTIHPPLSWSGSAGEYIASVCTTLFGDRVSEVRHATHSETMDHAIAIARSGLADIRERFESSQLDVHEKLLVKYALHGDPGTEYLWAYVTSWRDPHRILGTSSVNAVYHPKVRTGRPVVVDASAVVDWAVQHDLRGIVEGGWTQTALDDDEDQEPSADPPTAPRG